METYWPIWCCFLRWNPTSCVRPWSYSVRLPLSLRHFHWGPHLEGSLTQTARSLRRTEITVSLAFMTYHSRGKKFWRIQTLDPDTQTIHMISFTSSVPSGFQMDFCPVAIPKNHLTRPKINILFIYLDIIIHRCAQYFNQLKFFGTFYF